jgi:hypothetical protein
MSVSVCERSAVMPVASGYWYELNGELMQLAIVAMDETHLHGLTDMHRDRMSDEDNRMRFLGAISAESAGKSASDYCPVGAKAKHGGVGFIALIGDRLVGQASWVNYPLDNEMVGEFSVAVDQNVRRLPVWEQDVAMSGGDAEPLTLAKVVLGELFFAAKKSGEITSLTAEILFENQPSYKLVQSAAKRTGLEVKVAPDFEDSFYHITIPLPSAQ